MNGGLGDPLGAFHETPGLGCVEGVAMMLQDGCAVGQVHDRVDAGQVAAEIGGAGEVGEMASQHVARAGNGDGGAGDDRHVDAGSEGGKPFDQRAADGTSPAKDHDMHRVRPPISW